MEWFYDRDDWTDLPEERRLGGCRFADDHRPDRQGERHAALPGPGSHLASCEGSMTGKRGRSAVTGKFVSQASVRRNPKSTVNETVKPAKPKRGK
ncbi:hypothetical protein GCM10010196_21280 [Agromyces mediolanus]|uniref:Uncharacterized protein n=1 Tax=Agromyces mediolanus TaxID=41986 RepID=A0A918FBD6_AGRME|nr:hypothetical protein GCM10010196_21280 [Agromyces mediolanus]GLJ71924.1 hypothetical protein GCM10017583_11800 [Agromyces mediolanus]